MTHITIFQAAICRDLAEGGDGTRYFGSLGGWQSHMNASVLSGLVSAQGALTEAGAALGSACKSIPHGRAYFFSDQYGRAIMEVKADDA